MRMGHTVGIMWLVGLLPLGTPKPPRPPANTHIIPQSMLCWPVHGLCQWQWHARPIRPMIVLCSLAQPL